MRTFNVVGRIMAFVSLRCFIGGFCSKYLQFSCKLHCIRIEMSLDWGGRRSDLMRKEAEGHFMRCWATDLSGCDV